MFARVESDVAGRWDLVRIWLLVPIVLAACARHEDPGQVTQEALPAEAIAQRAQHQGADAVRLMSQQEAAAPAKQILFGDLHVHTTFSADAFLRSLPLMQGEGTHPPADACDFARFCSQLDFWSINDHAEALSPQHWRETKDAIRQCNAVSGDQRNPDVVAFLGWEWSQVGLTPEDHFGHKNVIFKNTGDDQVPLRPISALDRRLIGMMRERPPFWQRIQIPLHDLSNARRYFDFDLYQRELTNVPICPEGIDSRKLPANCTEVASSPDVLFEKLAQWGFDTIVIPHGNTWGLYTPAGSTWDKQLKGPMHDPERQTLIEVYSGHGNSEEYRDWKAVTTDENGALSCPPPTQDYLPCCWRAGEIVRSRCEDPKSEECERRVRQAQINFLQAGTAGRTTLPGTPLEEWKDCGQCRDCFNPAFNYRPGSSAQYALAIANFEEPGAPRHFTFGFIASSDNHSARPGTGYKEYGRRMMTEATGPRDRKWLERLTGGPPPQPAKESVPFDPTVPRPVTMALQTVDFERQASFFMTGGLVAVHSTGRDRDSVWAALKRREVYGTSGDRILLWFDLLNGPRGALPMGSETQLAAAPRFRVRAIGSFEQKPGCTEMSTSALSPQRLDYLCRGECYNPSDKRRLITRIEIVRIRPQVRPGEPVAELIDDPWKRFDCPADPSGCVFEFADPDFLTSGRSAVYYVRAVQEPTPAVNAGGLRCKYDEAGNCTEVNPCYGDFRTPFDDDCLSENEERAWSSPIYVHPGPRPEAELARQEGPEKGLLTPDSLTTRGTGSATGTNAVRRDPRGMPAAGSRDAREGRQCR
jgi:hypothetical protein